MHGTRDEPLEPGFESPLDAAISRRDRGVLSMVQQALSRGDARLAFQPIVRSDGRGIAFYEGLIRILDESGRVIPARDFMGAVEDSEIGRQIDCAALTIGLRTLREHPTLRLSINMSARSVGYPRWMKILRACLRDHPTVVERLILEMTESSAMMMPELVAIFMQDLQDKGITFALDDFGAGFTAFRHFKTFFFDILKIDGQFTANIAQDPDNQVVTEALISFASHFDMLTISESVETAEDAQWLAQAGIDCMQGYYYGAPTMRLPELDTSKVMRSA